MSNSALNHAKYSENTDSWYTTPETVEKEMSHYTKWFQNKRVLCNCDDPLESAFTTYFINHFQEMGLQELITTSYKSSQIGSTLCMKDLDESTLKVLHDLHQLSSAYMLRMTNSDSSINLLNNDGDFRKNLGLLDMVDVVVTNPPFSLFRELFHEIHLRHGLHFLLIANQNASLYPEVFPLIKHNLCTWGYTSGDMKFRVPPDTLPSKSRYWVDDNGQKWKSIGNAVWLTNLPVHTNYQLNLTCKYDATVYPHYDTFDAIHVDKVINIPIDYPGVMGVPITYLKYHNHQQFDIIGEANHGKDNEFDLFVPVIHGKEVFKCVLIQRKTITYGS